MPAILIFWNMILVPFFNVRLIDVTKENCMKRLNPSRNPKLPSIVEPRLRGGDARNQRQVAIRICSNCIDP